MRAAIFSVLTALIVGILPGVSFAQPCGVSSVSSSARIQTEWSVTVYPGKWRIVSCPSGVDAVGVGFYAYDVQIHVPLEELHCGPTPESFVLIDSPTEFEGGDAVSQSLDATVSVFSGEAFSRSAVRGTFQAQVSSCVSASQYTDSEFLSAVEQRCSSSLQTTTADSGMVVGYAITSRSMVFEQFCFGPDCEDFSYDREFSMSLVARYDGSSSGGCGNLAGPAVPVRVKFVAAYGRVISPSGETPFIESGLVAVSPSGSLSRLGMTASSVFEPNYNAITNTSSIDGSLILPLTVPVDLIEIQETWVVDSFEGFNGDIDRNGIVCIADSAAIQSTIGSVVNQSVSYNPRADFDLDGTVSASDWSTFQAMFGSANCIADFDCSGEVELLDLIAFNAAWNSQLGQTGASLSADTDFDQQVTLLDLILFNAAWSARLGGPGCR